jgi:hypothetical protein
VLPVVLPGAVPMGDVPPGAVVPPIVVPLGLDPGLMIIIRKLKGLSRFEGLK